MPIDQTKHGLIERRKPRDRGRHAPARPERADEIDEQAIGGMEHEARKAAGAVEARQAAVIVRDKGRTDFLIGVFARLFVMWTRQAALHYATDVVGVELFECDPALARFRPQQSQNT